MFILGIKNPDGTIDDMEVFDTMHDLRDAMAETIAMTGKHVGITAAKKQLAVFEEWNPTREFEAALDFEVLSAG